MNISINLSSSAPVITEQVLSVKDTCYGLVGANLLILVLVLIAINFLSFFFWRTLIDDVKFKMFGREFDLLFLLPVFNACVLALIFVMVYNLF